MLSIRTFLFAAAISATVPAAYGQDAQLQGPKVTTPSDEARARAELPRIGGPYAGQASTPEATAPTAPKAPAPAIAAPPRMRGEPAAAGAPTL